MLLVLSRDASRHCAHLPVSLQKKIKRKLILLEANPLLGKKLSGDLEGNYSLRAWPYRIIYQINDNEKRIEVSAILHRQGAYR